MLSKEEFIQKWKFHVAGMGMYGYVSEIADSPVEKAKKHHFITDETDKLLAKMYDSLGLPQPAPPPPAAPARQDAPPPPPRQPQPNPGFKR